MARWKTDVEFGLMQASALQTMSTEMENQLLAMKASVDAIDADRSIDTEFGDIAKQLSFEAQTRTQTLSRLLDELAVELRQVQMAYQAADDAAKVKMLGAAR